MRLPSRGKVSAKAKHRAAKFVESNKRMLKARAAAARKKAKACEKAMALPKGVKDIVIDR
jgi:hypothetical protein